MSIRICVSICILKYIKNILSLAVQSYLVFSIKLSQSYAIPVLIHIREEKE